MRATCKLCNAVIETDPDPLMDDKREQRERTAFFNRVAFHIDPKNKRCSPRPVEPEKGYQSTRGIPLAQQLVHNRFAVTMQDNGWFQRWRLLACVRDLDPKLQEKQEEWREYLNTITMKLVDLEASDEPIDLEKATKVH